MGDVGSSRAAALEQEYPLPGDAIATYQVEGHVRLDAVLSTAEVAFYRPAIQRQVHERSHEARPLAERDTYGKAFLQVGGLRHHDPVCRQFVLARRFAKLAADLMQVDAVRIYNDQALFKEPGGGHTPWHQDQVYWPLDGPQTITMWMPLVDIPEEVGSMRFVSGSHRFGEISGLTIGDPSQAFYERFIAEKKLHVSFYGAMRAGDATFHSGWTLHYAMGNPTPDSREVMTVIYFADGLRLMEPNNKEREVDARELFPGLTAGDLAASPSNHLVYRRTDSVARGG